MPKRVMRSFLRPRNTGSVSFRPVINRDSAVTVAGHSGHERHLLPLPRMRTAGDAFRCRLPMSNPAASSARAPLLYRNNRTAITVAKRLTPIRRLQQCIRLSSFEVADHILRGLLEGN